MHVKAVWMGVGVMLGLVAVLGLGAQAQGQGAKKAIYGGAKPIGPYTPGVSLGNLVFLSGQIGLDPATGTMVEGGVAAEAKQVMQNLGAVLKEAGLGYEHVVKTTIYLADINDFATVNEIYGSYFPEGGVAPARSTVQVAAIPRGARIEIDFVAAR